MKDLFGSTCRALRSAPATLSALAVAGLLGAATPAGAALPPGSNIWHMNGGSCTPTGTTMRNGQYWTVTGGGRVKYRSGNGVTPLTFTCPVSAISSFALDSDGAIQMTLNYQDPDGAGSTYRVQATLKSRHKITGVSNVNLCQAVSSTAGAWASATTGCFDGTRLVFDPATYFYWVEVIVSRTTPSSQTVEFNGVELRSVAN